MKTMLKSLFTLLALTTCAAQALAADRLTGRNDSMRSPIIAPHGMAASAHPLVSQIGIDILKSGGNAIDAAIAMNAALGLMEPTGSGMGGDLFAIVWDAQSQKLFGLNASGRSAQASSGEDIRAQGHAKMPDFGALPITVPGAVDGWFELHDRFGKLPMKDLLQPAIRYAREGHPIPPVIGYYWNRSLSRYAEFPEFQKTFAPGGRAPRVGEMFKNPNLASTYEIIAKKGRDGFYKGKIAEKIIEAIQQYGGVMGLEDLATHESEWVEPISTNYRGYDIWELPPNSQGIAALQILNLMEPYDVKSMGFGSVDYLHLFVEAKKLAYEDRAKYYADMAFSQVPLERLISKEYAKQRGKLLNQTGSASSYPAGDLALRRGDTTYLTVVDKDRNAISLIQSNYMGFGSGVVPQGTGFCLQNRGNLFNLDPDHANAYEPGKRPFHTIIPAFVTKNGKPLFSFGVMGGDMQPQGHVQVLCNIIDFGMNIQEAGDAPRVRHTGSSQPTGVAMTEGGELHLETGFADEVIRELMLRGHRVTSRVGGYGGFQGIWIDSRNGVLLGATESRKDGIAIGY